MKITVMCPVQIYFSDPADIPEVWRNLKDSGASMDSSGGFGYSIRTDKIKLKDCLATARTSGAEHE